MKSFLATFLACLLGACSVPKEAGFPDVQKLLQDRLAQRVHWNQGTPEDAKVEQVVRDLLSKPLTADSAVQIALLKNRKLQAVYEELAIAQAEVVQAGLLQNPIFAATARFPDTPPKRSNVEFGIAQDFLDILMIPARRKIASDQFEQVKLEVADEVLSFALEVRTAYYNVVSARQVADMRKMIAYAAEQSAELARRIHKAGNTSDLNLANERAAYQQAKADWAEAEEHVLEHREHLTTLLGLWGSEIDWKTVKRLPDVPAKEFPLDRAVSLALSRRLDLAAGRWEVLVLSRSLGMVTGFRLIADLEFGVSGERETEGQWVTGPEVAIRLPIFDQNQAAIAGLQAKLRQRQHRLAALAVEIRSEVRALRHRLMTTRYRIEHYLKVVIPLREQIVNLTLRQYNFMLVGAFELIEAKSMEYEAYEKYIEAVRDYWITRSQFLRAIGGAVPSN